MSFVKCRGNVGFILDYFLLMTKNLAHLFSTVSEFFKILQVFNSTNFSTLSASYGMCYSQFIFVCGI